MQRPLRTLRAAFPIVYALAQPNQFARARDRMLHSLIWTLIKIVLASLVAGTIMTHFGITADTLAAYVGLSQERVQELARQALAWALPNVALGAMVIVPIWFLVFLLRPPRRSSD